MTGLEDFELSRVHAFFRKITNRYETPEPVSVLVITHLLGERPAFLRAVGRLAKVAAILPKPKSIDARALEEVTAFWPVDGLERAAFADPAHVLEYLESWAAGRRVVLLDVGGYFAPGLEHMCAGFSGQIIGVVEDTEAMLSLTTGAADPVLGVSRHLAVDRGVMCPRCAPRRNSAQIGRSMPTSASCRAA